MTTDSGGYYSYFLTSKCPYFFLKAFSPEVHISYNILELMAEVGGYVGLFLGVSVNQFSDLIKSSFSSWNSIRNRLCNNS